MSRAISDLSLLLSQMQPVLNPGQYVFCTLGEQQLPVDVTPLATFREQEGMTVILARQDADRLSLSYTYVAAWITLNVHSALEAVGLTAAFSNALAQQGISCNVVAGFYHDHLFVAEADGEAAMATLFQLAGH
ncbi:hypothetical protein GCM10009425_15390 [Pseudomonas asuensis]|jgi:hypothetical protein|uniref:Aspartate kinase n=1 Tax=Pseudomonas asuensis TaxID=1825787 RepID=A0ABQ2GPB2_9PSED|nr:ACT domain-containing protein [Pseudomonas asuensis]GGM04983.1 hypothetical protein GCM10009425_15390 [Pseudomonas asuensis]